MGNISTFGTYALARLGIYAAQSAVTITGNNIANVSTKGYTRQFIDQVSLNMGGADRYASKMSTRIGSGAYVMGVTQLRDPYLDIRYRNEQTQVGSYEGWLEGLNQLANYYDKNVSDAGRGRYVFVGSSDAPKDVQRLKSLIEKKDGNVMFIEGSIGPVIGSHVGPEMVAIVFWGRDKRENLSIADKIAKKVKGR